MSYKKSNSKTIMEELKSFMDSVLGKGTVFTITKVYQYDTYPGYSIIAKDDRGFDEPWMREYKESFEEFEEALRKTLRREGLLDNKIGVQLEFTKPGWRDGLKGTIIWCYKDFHQGFFFNCYPGPYVKEKLNIEFTI